MEVSGTYRRTIQLEIRNPTTAVFPLDKTGALLYLSVAEAQMLRKELDEVLREAGR